MKNIFLLLLMSCLLQGSLQAQGWLQTYYDLSAAYFHSRSQKTLDNGYVIAGATRISSFIDHVTVRKLDVFGNVQWNYVLVNNGRQRVTSIKELPSDGSYLVFYDNNNPSVDFNILHVSATGQFISNTSHSSFTGYYNYKIELTSHDELLIVGTHRDTADIRSMQLTKMDLQGNILWNQIYTHAATFYEIGIDVKQTTDGNYVLTGRQSIVTGTNQTTGSNVQVIKVDTSGTVLWNQVYPTANGTKPYSLLATNDGGCLVLGQQSIGFDDFPMGQKIDPLGTSEWLWVSSTADDRADAGLLDAVELANGDFVCTGSSNYNYKLIAFVKLSATGQVLLEKGLSTSVAAHQGYNIYSDSVGSGFTIFGQDGSGPFLMAVDSIGTLFSNKIVGYYYNDYNSNCIQDIGEPGIAGRVISAVGDLGTRYASSSVDGSYEIEVDTGEHVVSATAYSPYWTLCPDQDTVDFSSSNSRDTVNFGLQATDSCLHLEVNISTAFIRRCFSSYYSITYRNIGTKVAQNAYIELTLDPYLTYDSSSIALTQQTGNVYRFDVGTIPAFSVGTFIVHFTTDCDSAALGQVHCTEAHIFPDTVCAPIIWTGSIINASSNCTNDSITFRLRNLGANMMSPQNYSIIEEHVMLRQAPFQLGSGADTLITIPTTAGNYYRIEANQESGFPPEMGDPIAVADNIGCNGRPVLNQPNILGQYYNGNVSSFVAVDCRANVGSYDPNDKQAQPEGYQANHYIENTIPLSYHIRFQNTGTDTAFTVVVVDTLDVPLDPATVRMGASSHPYTWELRENGILVVTFDNIMLPDSNVNEPLSNGFFKFSIDQDPNNPAGTRIENSAGIYFDFNPPVLTNEVFHTIGSNFINTIVINVDKVATPTIAVQVFPNPFAESTTIAVEGEQYEQLQVQVFTTTGQLVQELAAQGNQLTLTRGNLPAGLYVYRLLGDGTLLSTGKLMIK
ncbi:MAG: T9SS type A sorting domain-containing protein [Aureispira sp.]